MKPRILVIEDDRTMLDAIQLSLADQGYRVIEAHDGNEGLALALSQQPDLVVLDVMLPGLSGFELCRELRRLHFAPPILMLTGLNQVDDRVKGLNAGADDYLPKPFSLREFYARVQALLRRSERDRQHSLVLELGDVCVDLAHHTATRGGRPLSLTKTEYSLLNLLCQHAGEVVSRQTILDVVWGYTRFPSTRTVDTHIWRLRKKLGDGGDQPRWIQHVHGRGYSLTPDGLNSPDSDGAAPMNEVRDPEHKNVTGS
jgi:DNA-binding response OmpR family regulator